MRFHIFDNVDLDIRNDVEKYGKYVMTSKRMSYSMYILPLKVRNSVYDMKRHVMMSKGIT